MATASTLLSVRSIACADRAFHAAAVGPEVVEAQFARILAGKPLFGLVATDAEGGLHGLCHCIRSVRPL